MRRNRFKIIWQGCCAPRKRAAHTARALVRKGDRVLVVGPAEIDLGSKPNGDHGRLHVGLRAHLLRSTLTDMGQRLKPQGSMRIRRSRLVNLERIKEFITESPTELLVVFKNNEVSD